MDQWFWAGLALGLWLAAGEASAAPVIGGIADDPPDCRCAAWLCG